MRIRLLRALDPLAVAIGLNAFTEEYGFAVRLNALISRDMARSIAHRGSTAYSGDNSHIETNSFLPRLFVNVGLTKGNNYFTIYLF